MFAMAMVYGGVRASAQECPNFSSSGVDTASQTKTLEGRLIYHDGIRQWFELKLNRKQCGKNSVQLTMSGGDWKSLQILRGCQIRATGRIYLSPTGYYSLDTYQNATELRSLGVCARKPLFVDYSKFAPDKNIAGYRVDMNVDYRSGDHPIVFHVRSGARELRPWQAYASYMLTGGDVLYGLCGRGFVVDKVSGTPAARPSHFDEPRTSGDMATFDPETAAQAGNFDLHLRYICIREHSG